MKWAPGRLRQQEQGPLPQVPGVRHSPQPLHRVGGQSGERTGKRVGGARDQHGNRSQHRHGRDVARKSTLAAERDTGEDDRPEP